MRYEAPASFKCGRIRLCLPHRDVKVCDVHNPCQISVAGAQVDPLPAWEGRLVEVTVSVGSLPLKCPRTLYTLRLTLCRFGSGYGLTLTILMSVL